MLWSVMHLLIFATCCMLCEWLFDQEEQDGIADESVLLVAVQPIKSQEDLSLQ